MRNWNRLVFTVCGVCCSLLDGCLSIATNGLLGC